MGLVCVGVLRLRIAWRRRRLKDRLMGALHVLGEVATLHGRITADVAFVVEQTGMCAKMLGEVVAHPETFVAVLAKVFRLFGMHGQMTRQVATEFEFLKAKLTPEERWLSRVVCAG